MLTARTKTIERTGTGRQFPPSLASLSATKISLQIYMELTVMSQPAPGTQLQVREPGAVYLELAGSSSFHFAVFAFTRV